MCAAGRTTAASRQGGAAARSDRRSSGVPAWWSENLSIRGQKTATIKLHKPFTDGICIHVSREDIIRAPVHHVRLPGYESRLVAGALLVLGQLGEGGDGGVKQQPEVTRHPQALGVR